jgi:hypothetical protein
LRLSSFDGILKHGGLEKSVPTYNYLNIPIKEKVDNGKFQLSVVAESQMKMTGSR